MSADWALPEKYAFVAPRGCGTELSQSLDDKEKLKTHFFEKLGVQKGVTGDLDSEAVARLKLFSENVDFSIFQEEDLEDILESHRQSPYHLRRFGGALPPRTAPEDPPALPAAHENQYIRALISAYRESYGNEYDDFDACSTRGQTASHLLRQREAFYCAESLREFARDQVPEGTYEGLIDEIYYGVVATAERTFPLGLERLTAVLEQSVRVQIDANALIQATLSRDKHGICHQLANEDRLEWVRQ